MAPRTPFEDSLAKIWNEVLGLDQVGIYDDFMELGGDSLRATQVISRVIDLFQVEVPLKVLLEAPTIADMAVTILQYLAKDADPQDIDRMLAELNANSD
jgi:acyl carrier protein